MNRYYFSPTFGVGILLEEVNSKLNIKFKTGIKNLGLNEAIEVPQDIIDTTINKDIDSFFNYETVRRATEYINHIPNYYIMGKSLKGIVYGTSPYTSTITFSKSGINASCTCPVGKDCKHAYALLKTFSNDLELISDDIQIEESSSDNNIFFMLRSYQRSKKMLDRFNISKEIVDIMKKSPDNNLVEMLDEIDNMRTRETSFLSVKRTILFNDDLVSRILDLKSRFNTNKFVKDLLNDRNTVKYYLQANNYSMNGDLLIEYHYYKQNYKDLIIGILSRPLFNPEFGEIISDAIDKVFIDDDIENIFKSYIHNNYRADNDIVSKIICKTKKMAYLSLLSRGYELKLPSNIISEIPSNDVVKYINYFNVDYKLLEYINNYLPLFIKDNFNGLIDIILDSYKDYQTEVNKILEIMPHSRYLREYLEGTIDYLNIDKYEFFYIFNPTYKAINNSALKDIEYNVFLGSHNVINFIVRNGNISYYNLNNLTKSEFEEFASYIYDELLKSFEYKLFIDSYNKEVRSVYQEKRSNEINRIIDKYTPNVITNRDKARIEISLNINSYRNNVSIEMRVGIDKLYVVKNIEAFLYYVTTSQNISYGKGLTLNHNINNFDDSSQNKIRFLLCLGDSTFNKKDYKEYGITDYAANELIRLHKNEYLIINDKKYFVRLEERKNEYYIDNKYKIRSSLPFESIQIGEVNYIYSENDNLDILKTISDPHYDLIMQSLKGMDISYSIDKFKEDVFYKYQNLIKIDNQISDKFIINDVRIDAYFDYDDKVITLNSYLYKNDELIDQSKLDKNDKVKVMNFISYITSMGFHDNIIDDENYIYLFLTMDFSDLKSLCNVYLSESIKKKNVIRLNPPTIRVRYQNNIMDVFTEESDYSDEELYKILKAISKKKKYILLDNDRIIDISGKDAEDFISSVDELIGSYEDLSSPHQIPFYQAIKAFSHQNNTTIDEYLISMYYELTSFKKAKYPIPEINGELRKYQKEGYYFLKILSKYGLGGILADDMGLGKTLEIITLILSDNANAPSLIVCPKSLMFNWMMEFEKFTAGMNVVIVAGDQKVRHRIINGIDNEEKTIYITAYDSLRNDIELYDDKIFNYLILDEAQFIKNVAATKSKSVKKLMAAHRFALTGTPIENNILDLWSIFDFIMPGYLDNLNNFRVKYSASPEYEDLISKKIKLFILRRTKKEVLTDLPEKYERIVSCEMTPKQLMLYEAYKLQARKAMEEEESTMAVMPYLMRLRQICVDPNTFVENYDGESAKMEELKRILDDYILNDHKLLIFSSFVKALEIVEEILKERSISYLVLTGETKIDDRMESVRRFNSDKTIKVFLISLKAGGTGLNLVGADTVVHLDPWWNVAAMDQASDRAHRIGQQRNVEVIKLVCEDSIEQRVIELQNIKKDLIDKMISKDDSSITNFDLKDLGYILK